MASLLALILIRNNMKSRKQPARKRNLFAVLAYFRKAGSHRKPHKAQRGALNREGWDG